MPKFHYAKHGESFGIESQVDGGEYTEALAMFAECFKVPPASIEYLLQYGVNQTTQDSMAQPVAKAKEEGGDAVAAAIAAAQKRWDSINEGTAGVRGGGFRVTDPHEKAVREIIDSRIKAAVKAKAGAKMPKGDALQKLRQDFYSKHKDAIDKLAAERVAMEASLDIEVKL